MTQVLFDPHPKFNHRFFSADYGERYHLDPEYRSAEQLRISGELKERYRKYQGVVMGNFEDAHTLPPVGIESLDFLNIALGATPRYSADEMVWTTAKPFENVESVKDVQDLPEIDWPHSPVLNDMIRQFEELRKLYPGRRPSTFQNIEFQGDDASPDQAMLVIHTPYTTAFRLMGEKLFELMLCEEETADALFEYIFRQNENMFRYICARYNWHPCGICFGDCAATMLSPSLFERFNAPFYDRIGQKYGHVWLHSCGPSAHLISLFTKIRNLDHIQVGMGSDFPRLRELFPDKHIMAFHSPFLIRSGTAEENVRALRETDTALGSNTLVLLSSVDPDTPEDTLDALLENASAINKRDNHK